MLHAHEHEGTKGGYADEQRGADAAAAAASVSDETFAEVEGGLVHLACLLVLETICNFSC